MSGEKGRPRWSPENQSHHNGQDTENYPFLKALLVKGRGASSACFL